jgi:hypothetical protein
VSPVKYELGFYISEDNILHSHCRENFKSYQLSLGFRPPQELNHRFHIAVVRVRSQFESGGTCGERSFTARVLLLALRFPCPLSGHGAATQRGQCMDNSDVY